MTADVTDSRPARWLIAPLAALGLLLVAACGGSGDATESGVLADRILRLGEDAETIVDVRMGETPVGLSEALNAGMTPGTPDEDLIELHVHRPQDLVGSFLIKRASGTQSFWLIYDHAEDALTVEVALLAILDETPWQVIAGQSTSSESGVRFQSTVSGDIDGTAIIHPVRLAEAEGGVLTTVTYIVEVQPAELAQPSDFELPAPRPIPDAFPADFLLLEGTIPITVLWGASPGGKTFQMVLLTRESAFDIAEQYRNILASEGWELVADRAIGFATQLDFQTDAGALQGSLTAGAFEDDDDYTSVVLEVRVTSGGAN